LKGHEFIRAESSKERFWALAVESGSAWGPVILPVFKTGERQVSLSLVCSTRTRFRQILSPQMNADHADQKKQTPEICSSNQRELSFRAKRGICISFELKLKSRW